ncbi:MAG: accessory factor UbiK family protein [Proteobacteria bacterium]|nr:accessory factor UbiK family protein [Pseudomonadota bacterium]
MQSRNRILDDVARVAGGAIATVAGLKREFDDLVRVRLERLLADLDLVTREEFEATREMAAKARAEQERLSARVADLEAALARATRRRRAPKPESEAPTSTSASKPPSRE